MISILKIISRYVYPAIRRRLVEILYKEYNLRQDDVARMLNITQSAVSRYVKINRGSFINIAEFKDIDSELKNLADRIVTSNIDMLELEYELTRITFVTLGKGYICRYHKYIDNEIDPKTCKICIKLFKVYT